MFVYEFKFAGTHLKGGKAFARELTEEEKKVVEDKKAKPVAGADKKKKGEEEPSAEELARLAEEIKEREMTNTRRKEEWASLDENQKFFRTCEDATKEPAIRFVSAESRPDDALPSNTAIINLQDAALRHLESSICDTKGMWLYFEKVVPQEDEHAAEKGAPAAKKAPAKAAAKGGTANAEDLKPTYAKGWFNLVPLMHPGVKSLTQRIFLQQTTQG